MENTDFYFENNLAFTRAENILITNILAEGIEEETTNNVLQKYFEDFGEVNSLTFNEIELNNLRSANIIFKSPIAAAKVLLHKEHKNLAVKPNDCWLQPLPNGPLHREPTNQNKALTDLGDVCLLQIISKLELKDQLSLACSNRRFKSVFETYAKNKLTAINVTYLECLSQWQAQQFFLVAGKHIKKFSFMNGFKKRHSSFLQLLTIYCKNLEVLVVAQLALDEAENLNKLLLKNQKLKSLYMYGCFIKDEFAAIISKLPLVEQLSLVCCNHITGNNFVLPNLKELNILSCNKLENSYLEDALPLMSKLTKLSLSDHNSKLIFIVENLHLLCKNLEFLNLDCPKASYESVLKLNNLKCIHFANLGANNSFDQLIQERSNQIESFAIDCFYLKTEQIDLISKLQNLRSLLFTRATNRHLISLDKLCNLENIDLSKCTAVSNQALLELVLCCFKLKHVCIEYTLIDNKFAEALLPLIANSKRPNGKLQFFAHCSQIKKSQLPEAYFSAELKPLVKFVFESYEAPIETSLIFPFDGFRFYKAIDFCKR